MSLGDGSLIMDHSKFCLSTPFFLVKYIDGTSFYSNAAGREHMLQTTDVKYNPLEARQTSFHAEEKLA